MTHPTIEEACHKMGLEPEAGHGRYMPAAALIEQQAARIAELEGRAEAAERELAAVKKEAGFLRAALRVNTMRSGATNEEIDALLKKAKEHDEQKDGGNE